MPDDGILALTTRPVGASVMVGEEFAGRSPVKTALAPGADHRVRVSKPGYRPVEVVVRVGSGKTRSLQLDLEPVTGKVQLTIAPPDAWVKIDGAAVEPSGGTLELPAVPHRLEVGRKGYLPHRGVSIFPR